MRESAAPTALPTVRFDLPGSSFTLSATGSLLDKQNTNMDVDLGLPYTENDGGSDADGWHLVGNPFMAPLDWDLFLTHREVGRQGPQPNPDSSRRVPSTAASLPFSSVPRTQDERPLQPLCPPCPAACTSSDSALSPPYAPKSSSSLTERSAPAPGGTVRKRFAYQIRLHSSGVQMRCCGTSTWTRHTRVPDALAPPTELPYEYGFGVGIPPQYQ